MGQDLSDVILTITDHTSAQIDHYLPCELRSVAKASGDRPRQSEEAAKEAEDEVEAEAVVIDGVIETR